MFCHYFCFFPTSLFFFRNSNCMYIIIFGGFTRTHKTGTFFLLGYNWGRGRMCIMEKISRFDYIKTKQIPPPQTSACYYIYDLRHQKANGKLGGIFAVCRSKGWYH